MSVRLHLPLCCGRTVPEISEEKGSYALRFYRWFLESFKSCLYNSRGSARLNWHSCTVAGLKVLDKESLPQHNIVGLISGIKFIVLFRQEKPLRWKEINTHAHTHTHTHTVTSIHSIQKSTRNSQKLGNKLFRPVSWWMPAEDSIVKTEKNGVDKVKSSEEKEKRRCSD